MICINMQKKIALLGVLMIALLVTVLCGYVTSPPEISETQKDTGKAVDTGKTAKPYTFSIEVRDTGNGQGKVMITISAAKGHKINKEFPVKLKAEAKGAVKLPKAKLKGKDAKMSNCAMTMELPYSLGDKPKGDEAISFQLRFGTCSLKKGADCKKHSDDDIIQCLYNKERHEIKIPSK